MSKKACQCLANKEIHVILDEQSALRIRLSKLEDDLFFIKSIALTVIFVAVVVLACFGVVAITG